MKIPSAEYDALVAQKQAELRGHKHTQLTESECKSEVAEILGEAKSSFEDEELIELEKSVGIGIDMQPKKRRGRPPGSKNKPKT